MSKTNFEAIAAGAQELGRFLRSLPILEAPWDTEFQKRYGRVLLYSCFCEIAASMSIPAYPQ